MKIAAGSDPSVQDDTAAKAATCHSCGQLAQHAEKFVSDLAQEVEQAKGGTVDEETISALERAIPLVEQ